MFFVIAFLGLFSLALVEQSRLPPSGRTFIFAAVTATVVAIPALRYEGLADYGTYASMFHSIDVNVGSILEVFTYYFEHQKAEPLNVILAKVGMLLGGTVSVFLLYSLLTGAVWSAAAYRLTPYPALALLAFYSHYFLYLNMGQIRAGIAYALIALAVSFLVYGYRFWMLVATVFAVLFHFSSAIFLFAFPFILGRAPSRGMLVLFLMAGLAVGASGLGAFLVHNAYALMGEPSQLKSYVWERYTDTIGPVDLTMIKFLIIVGIGMYVRPYVNEYRRVYDVLLTILVLGVSIRAALAGFDVLGGRLSALFFYFEPFFLGVLLLAFRERLIAWCLVCAGITAQFLLNIDKKLLYEGFSTILS